MAVLDDPSCRVCFGHSIDSSRQNSTSEDDKDGDLGKLIRVCACNGSIAFIHEGCLRRWIMVSSNPIDRTRCPQCRTKYLTRRRRLGFAANAVKWGCTGALAAALHIAVFATALPWVASCCSNRWYGKLARVADLSNVWSTNIQKATLLKPRARTRQDAYSQLNGQLGSKVLVGTPLSTSHANSLHSHGWWDLSIKPALWAIAIHNELQWRIVAEPRPPPSLRQGGAVDFTLGGTLFRFTLTGRKRRTNIDQSLPNVSAGSSKQQNSASEPSTLASRAPTARSLQKKSLSMSQSASSDDNTDTADVNTIKSSNPDLTVSSLFLRALQLLLGGPDNVGLNHQGGKRPRQPHRTDSAPNQEPTDPLSMAAAAAMATARGKSLDAAAQKHSTEARNSARAGSTLRSIAESVASNMISPNKGRDDPQKGVLRDIAKDDTRKASTLVHSQEEVVEIGVLDVLELMMSMGPFDLVVRATWALVANSHTDHVASASAAAASSMRRRAKFKGTVAAAMEAKEAATSATGASLQAGDKSEVDNDVVARSGTKPSSCDAAALEKSSNPDNASDPNVCYSESVKDGYDYNKQRDEAPYGMQNVCQRVGKWEWSGALIYGTIRAGTTWCMLVLTLGPSLAAFVAIFPRGHKPKAWPFALLWACLAASWLVASKTEPNSLHFDTTFCLIAVILAGLIVEMAMIAHAVEESVYYLTRDTAWGLRQVEVMERPGSTSGAFSAAN